MEFDDTEAVERILDGRETTDGTETPDANLTAEEARSVIAHCCLAQSSGVASNVRSFTTVLTHVLPVCILGVMSL